MGHKLQLKITENSQVLSGRIKYIPILLIEIYLWFSYLLYRFGVWKWPFRNDNRILIFILLCNGMLLLGYILAAKIKINNLTKVTYSISINKVILICSIISLILFLPSCKSYTGYYFPPIIEAIKNPIKIYYEIASFASQRTSIRVLGLFDIFTYCLFPLTVYYWEEIERKIRAISIFTIIIYLGMYMSCAKNIYMFMLFVSVAIPFLCTLCNYISMKQHIKSNKLKNNHETDIETDRALDIRTNKRKLLRTSVILVLFLALFILMFKLNLASRTLYTADIEDKLNNIPGINTGDNSEIADNDSSQNGISGNELSDNINYNGLIISKEQIENYKKIFEVYPIYTGDNSYAYVNMNDKLLNLLPVSMRFIYVMGTSYLTNGYHGLTVALHTDYKSTFGLGHSAFLMDYFERITGVPINENSYYYRMTNTATPKIVSTSMWASAYAQYADDLTFPGVVVLMFIFGFVLYFIWIDAINGSNIFAIILLSQVAVQYLFLPANSILENSGGYFVTFYGILFMWLLTKIIPFIKNKKTVKKK